MNAARPQLSPLRTLFCFCGVVRIAMLVLALFAPSALAGVATMYSRAQGISALAPSARGDAYFPGPQPPSIDRTAAMTVAGSPGAAACCTSDRAS